MSDRSSRDLILEAVANANRETMRYAQAALLLRATIKRLAVHDQVAVMLKDTAMAATAWMDEK